VLAFHSSGLVLAQARWNETSPRGSALLENGMSVVDVATLAVTAAVPPAALQAETAAPSRAIAPQPADQAAQAQTSTARPVPWWVWVAGGAVVVVGVVIAGVLTTSQSSTSVAEPIPGNVGGTIQTLDRR
jgi:hypothetical protein